MAWLEAMSRDTRSWVCSARRLEKGVALPIRAAVFPLLALASCGPLPGSFENFLDKGLPKAAFDLECPQTDLEAKELTPGSVGVTGCGKRARYEYVGAAGGWVANAGADADPK